MYLSFKERLGLYPAIVFHTNFLPSYGGSFWCYFHNKYNGDASSFAIFFFRSRIQCKSISRSTYCSPTYCVIRALSIMNGAFSDQSHHITNITIQPCKSYGLVCTFRTNYLIEVKTTNAKQQKWNKKTFYKPFSGVNDSLLSSFFSLFFRKTRNCGVEISLVHG